MSRFTDVVKQDTPRLVVEYRKTDDGQEQFKWGMVGNLPILSVIGGIVRAQDDLIHSAEIEECQGASAFVMAWVKDWVDDEEREGFISFIDLCIPCEPLLGMLEKIKAMLVGACLQAEVKQVASGIVGPNGLPIPRMNFKGK